MKKLLLAFIFMITLIPNIVSAVEGVECSYEGDNLYVSVFINKENYIDPKVTIYKFGDDLYQDGKPVLFGINVHNYYNSASHEYSTIDKYEDSVNQTCPKYILVEGYGTYDAYVSNDFSRLQTFANDAFSGTEKKYFGTYLQPGEENESMDNIDRNCYYSYTNESGENILDAKLIIYENSRNWSASASKYLNGTLPSRPIANQDDYNYTGSCPKYLLFSTYTSNPDNYYYISDNKSELESIASSKYGNNYIIGNFFEESTTNLATAKTCNYSNAISNCSNCEISITFKSPNNFIVGSSVVSDYSIISGNISNLSFKGGGWNYLKSSSNEVYRPFYSVLPQRCPSDILFEYDEESRSLDIYVNESYYFVSDAYNPVIENYEDCSSFLGDPSKEKSPAWYLSFVFDVIKYVAIILLIVLTVIDFVGAVASQDNDSIKKSASKALKRAILCVILFVLPTLIDFVLQFIHDSSIRDCIR